MCRYLLCLLFWGLGSCIVSSAMAQESSDPMLPNSTIKWDLKRCIDFALKRSAQIEEAQAKVKEYQAILAEVESVYYPKLIGMAYLAPMFTVKGNIYNYNRKWKNIQDWGPYTHLEAILAQPLYTFGRAEAGETAARERATVERARLREAELLISYEVKKFYYSFLYARSFMPALNNAAKIVREAVEKANEMYDTGSGEVTQSDIMKLAYAATEVDKYVLMAEQGAFLALSALKHTMGMPDNIPLELQDNTLPKANEKPTIDLIECLSEAAEKRPEWQQINHGKKAAEALKESEIKALLPVLFLAGQFKADWTPTRDSTDNPYHFDTYNQVFGGLAIGLQFDIDPGLALAKSDQAQALSEQIEALRHFAETGIPLRVKKAHSDVNTKYRLHEIATSAVKSTRKWMAFSGAAYTTGTGEARDLLEGIAAYLMAKKDYYDSLFGYHVSVAELDFSIGR